MIIFIENILVHSPQTIIHKHFDTFYILSGLNFTFKNENPIENYAQKWAVNYNQNLSHCPWMMQ